MAHPPTSDAMLIHSYRAMAQEVTTNVPTVNSSRNTNIANTVQSQTLTNQDHLKSIDKVYGHTGQSKDKKMPVASTSALTSGALNSLSNVPHTNLFTEKSNSNPHNSL